MAEEESKVQKLDETLYSRTRYQNPLDKRSQVSADELPEVAPDWETPALGEILTRERQSLEAAPFLKKFFIFALLFFVATIAVAGFVFFGGTNFISSKNVDLTVVGPTEMPGGKVAELQVTITNGNNADLELANFSVQYPQGARNPGDSSQALTFTKEDLGVIKAGDEVVRNVRFFLVGQQGETKELKFSVEYKVSGSKATFYKDKVYQFTIGNSPLSLAVGAPEAVTSGESFATVVTVTLNSTEVLKNVMLRAEYPYGYSVDSAAPAAFSEDNVWTLGDLSPGSSKKIEIKGRLVGEDQDERTFRFYAGVAEGTSPSPRFKTTILSAQETIAVDRPSVDLRVTFNGEDAPVYVAPIGQNINAVIRFQNNLPDKLLNPRLEVHLSGAAVNESSVTAYNNGFYDSGTDRIIWSLAGQEGSSELLPGDQGFTSFRFASMADIPVGRSRDITLAISLTGTPLGGRQALTVRESRTVKVASQVTLSSKALHSTGPFDNKGPMPPQAEKETTYSVLWSVGNTQNAVNDAKVTARLGPAVKWVRAYSAASEDVSYDEASNTVTWNLGGLSSGTGFSEPLREVAFQIALTPSVSQVGTAPTLVTNIGFSGFETVAQREITVTSPALTTRLSSDPAFIQGDDIVVK